MAKGNGNGNGNGQDLPKTRTRFGTDRMPEIGVILGFIVQHLHKPTFEEILAAIKAPPPKGVYATIHKTTVQRVLEGLKKAKFVTDSPCMGEDGYGQMAWSVRTVWRNPPEMMQADSLLKVLHTNDSAEQIMAWFNSQEDTGTKKAKKEGPGELHNFLVELISTDMWIGSMPKAGQLFGMIHGQYPSLLDKNSVDIKSYWDRDEATGLYRISPDVQQGWFGTNVARYFKSGGRWWGELVAFKPILFTPHKPTVQVQLPCTGGPKGQGGSNAGPQFYEGLLPGQHMIMEFTAPTKKFMTPQQLEAFIAISGLRPRWGLSPARGRKYGRFVVVRFEDLGAVDGMKIETALAEDIPSWVKDEVKDYYAGLVQRIPILDLAEPEIDAGPMPTEADPASVDAN